MPYSKNCSFLHTRVKFLKDLLVPRSAPQAINKINKEVEAVEVAKVETAPVAPEQEVETVQIEEVAAIPVLHRQEVPAAETEEVSASPAEPEDKLASLFLSEKESLAGLFSLFGANVRQTSLSETEVHWGLSIRRARSASSL